MKLAGMSFAQLWVAMWTTALWLRITALSCILLRRQLGAVALLAKAMEDFYFATVYRMEKMVESGESDHNVLAFSYRMEEEVDHYKKKSINTLITMHPQFFKQLIEFEDWGSAMKYLETHKT